MRSSDSADGEARAGFLPVPQSIISVPKPIAAVFTIGVDAPGQAWRPSAKSWGFASVIVIASIGIWQSPHDRPDPPSPPPVVATRVPAAMPPVERIEPPRQRSTAPAATSPPVHPKSNALPIHQNDDRALDPLREALARQLRRAGELIDLETFDQADEELERIAAKIQRFPSELTAEREQHHALWRRLFQARVAAETARAKRALEQAEWERRLGLIEAQLTNGSFPEAEKLAASLIDDPSVPASVANRARELRQRAKNELKEIFSNTKTGTTTNTIRKHR